MSNSEEYPIDASKKKFLSDFEEIEEIIKGSTAITKKYKEKKTGQFYCVKKYYYSYEIDFKRECSTLSQLSKSKIPSLLSLYGYLDYPNEMYIITKYYPKNLRNFINSTELMSPSDIYIILLGIAEGMKYFHSINKIHRDLKPENILIDINDQGDLKPVICDYGLAREISTEKMTKRIGTNIYRSPEIETPVYDEKVDVYSFSIIFYELYSVEPPFPGEDTNSLDFYNKVVNENYRPKLDKVQLNQNIKDYINKCWDSDPKKRPSFEEIIEKLKSNEFRNFLNSDDKKTAEYLAEFNDSLAPIDPVLAKQLADTGNVENEIKYADLILKSNKNEALIYFERAAQKNSAYANLQCALLQVDLNHNNDESRLKASQYLKTAIDLGNYEALKIFIKDNYGQLSKDDLEKSYKICAMNGNPEAMFKYGEILYQNNDKENALYFFMEAANKRNIPSISRAARMLDEGDGVNEDKSKAKIYFDIGKKLNDSYSMLFKAISMLNNNYSDINNAEIVENFREAANLGNSNAKFFYAIILKHGYLGEDINKKLSRDNINEAKNLISDDDAKLAFDFAKKIMKGEIKCFHPKDEEVFLECASKKGIVDAMISYADFLCNAKNETEALKWLKRAANNGSKIAREKYCNLCGVFHKLFYNLEKTRIDYNVDLLEHVISVLVVSLADENKPRIMADMRKKNVSTIDDVLTEISDAYKFVYDKDPNNMLIRKLLEKNLNDSDFQ